MDRRLWTVDFNAIKVEYNSPPSRAPGPILPHNQGNHSYKPVLMVILHDYTMNRHNLATTACYCQAPSISLHSCINNPKSLAAENTAPADVKTVADKTSPWARAPPTKP